MTTLLDRLEALREAATAGEWRLAGNYRQCVLIGHGDDRIYAQVGSANAALIVASVNALPALIRALRAYAEFDDVIACLAVHQFAVLLDIGVALDALEDADTREGT